MDVQIKLVTKSFEINTRMKRPDHKCNEKSFGKFRSFKKLAQWAPIGPMGAHFTMTDFGGKGGG